MTVIRDVKYDITALREQGISVDRYFETPAEDNAPSFTNQFTDGVSPESLQDGKLLADVSSSDYVAGVSGWIIKANGDVEFNDGDFRGNVEVGSIDIGGADASSAHIDTDGNFWLGASTYAAAPARISKEGNAVFESIAVGGDTIQYVITNSGIFSFGDGSDGNATCDGSATVAGMSRSGSTYTMTRDVYFNNLTVNSSVTIDCAGYRIFVKDTLTVNGHIHRDGIAGGNGSGTAGGSGSTQADGYLKGSGVAPGGGGGGSEGGAGGNGTAGTSASNCLGSNGATGGAAGYNGGGLPASGTASAGGTATLANVKLIANWHLATLLDVSSTGATVKFTPTAGAGSGGGGTGQNGGGGGGAGGSGGVVAIYAKTIVIGAAGSITANGKNGGNGGNATNGFAGRGGGGGGGNGGVIVLAYNSLTNGGSITVSAGTGGLKGTVGASSGAQDGGTGSVGVIYQFELSL